MLCFTPHCTFVAIFPILCILISCGPRRIYNIGTSFSLFPPELGFGSSVLHKARWRFFTHSGTAYFLSFDFCAVPSLAVRVMGVGALTEMSISSVFHSWYDYYYPPHTYSVRIAPEAMSVFFPPNRSSCSSWISSPTRIRNQ